MSLFVKVRQWLTDPRLHGVDVNSDDLLKIHKKILREKKLMNKVFSDFYDACYTADIKYFKGEGKRVEIGAGVSFFKEKYPEVYSTDIKFAEGLDAVLDAQNMDLPDGSVRAIYGLNCFHHFPEPEKFFCELDRVLVPGGGCVLIEPYHGFVASRFYKKLFDTETFDKNQKSWSNSDNQIMTGANQALSYIVFIRDLQHFEIKFQTLKIIKQRALNNYLEYLLSGGLNFRSIIPYYLRLIPLIFQFLSYPFRNIFALHHIIIIQKKHE